MRRFPIQLDDSTYQALRRRAFEQRRSLAAVARDAIREAVGEPVERGPFSLADFPFVGAGRARGRSARPVSETHDDELATAYSRKPGR